MEESQELKLYWANVCLLIRMERQHLDDKAEEWTKNSGHPIDINYLGDTAEVPLREKLTEEAAGGKFEADAVVSTRFDLFCSKNFLAGIPEEFAPLGDDLPLRKSFLNSGICHPQGIFHPVLAVPHLIICNTEKTGPGGHPESLKDLLDTGWESQIVIGDPALPSGRCFLFAMWYLFGDEGLEKIVENVVAKSAPSAARFSIMKDEFKLAILPEIFAGPTQKDNLKRIIPLEGIIALPSYLAIKKRAKERLLPFLKEAVYTDYFQEQYVRQGALIPNHETLPPPENLSGLEEKMFFPKWSWIERRDMNYFDQQCNRVRIV